MIYDSWPKFSIKHISGCVAIILSNLIMLNKQTKMDNEVFAGWAYWKHDH